MPELPRPLKTWTRPDRKGKRAPLWKPGQSGNPHGRPRGARNRLSTEFLEALAQDFHLKGRSAIVMCRRKTPDKYLTIIAALVPRQTHIKVSEENPLSLSAQDATVKFMDELTRHLEAKGYAGERLEHERDKLAGALIDGEATLIEADELLEHHAE